MPGFKGIKSWAPVGESSRMTFLAGMTNRNQAKSASLPTREAAVSNVFCGLNFSRVFGLVTASYDEIPLAARCFKETAELKGAQTAVAQDHLIMSTNDQSGYFVLSRPATGWATGLYRCGLFAGEQTSAYTQVDEVRFRILESLTPPNTGSGDLQG